MPQPAPQQPRRRGHGHGSNGPRNTSRRPGQTGDIAAAAPSSPAAPTSLPVSPDPSSRSAAEVFKDAQDAAAELKALLKAQPPWSREADAVRQRARNAYLAVLFSHPLSPHAQSIDLLWLNTSYALIAAYRDVVARIEAVLPARRNGAAGGNGGGSGVDAASDLRRTLTRFRSALVSEDTFYRQLISRVVAFYQLQDRAREHLALVGVPVADSGTNGLGEDERPRELQGFAPILSREESEKKVGIVYKGLICLGDLERYKEQYSERARREAREIRQGVTLATAGTGREGEDTFGRAILYYEVARGLQPDNGTAFNQLAVIEGYLADNFHCTYHYYRALAVRQPFPGGEANLERVLKRVFDKWRTSRHAAGDSGNVSEPESPRDDAQVFRRDFLVMLSIIFVKAGTTHLASLKATVVPLLAHLLQTRQLPSEAIVKTTVMAIGSHWYARLGASTVPPLEAGAADTNGKLARRKHTVEELALDFVLSIFTTLAEVSSDEIEAVLIARAEITDDSAIATDDDPTPPPESEQRDATALAQNITAVVRRILPSLRILSRWIKSHLEYLSRAAQCANPDLAKTVTSFWATYKRLMLALARLFPLSQMPGLDEPLEEDIDMRGFLPLRRGLTAVGTTSSLSGVDDVDVEPRRKHEVHPNEEQLMRIADLLVDVKLLMQTEAGSIALMTGAPVIAPREADEIASVSTEDDPVNMAMRATLGEGSSVGDDRLDDDDDEEVIVWGRSTPTVHESAPVPTAFDLLQTLSIAPSHNSSANQIHQQQQQVSHLPQVHANHGQPGQSSPGLLFGGDFAGGSSSIWTMSREESQKGAQRVSTSAMPIAPPISSLWNDSPATSQPRQSVSSTWQQQPFSTAPGASPMQTGMPSGPPPGLVGIPGVPGVPPPANWSAPRTHSASANVWGPVDTGLWGQSPGVAHSGNAQWSGYHPS